MDMDNVFVNEMSDNNLQLYDEEGAVVELPIIGMFKVEEKYYMVVYIKPDNEDDENKGELVMLRVERDEEREYVQMITDKEEWSIAVEAWQKISEKATTVGVVPIIGQ